MADLMRGRRPPFFPPYVNNLRDDFCICVTPGMPNYARADAMVVYRFLDHAHPITWQCRNHGRKENKNVGARGAGEEGLERVKKAEVQIGN